MLRKKLLTRLGLLVVMFVTGAVVSISLLQGVLRDIDAAKSVALGDRLQTLQSDLERFESESAAIRQGRAAEPGALAKLEGRLKADLDRLVGDQAADAPTSQAPQARLPALLEAVLAASRAPAPSAEPAPALASASAGLHAELIDLATRSRAALAAEQSTLSRRLRTLIIALTLAALLSTNVAIFILVGTANMILRPVGELIEGSRELAQEHFDYRVRVTQHGEFEELATAYNALAEQLRANEARKVSALRHLAVTLNHEFNNIINVIELKLKQFDRRAGADPRLASHLDDIHLSLRRMSETIASLQNVRRVALIPYMPGQLMLDLPRCIAADEEAAPAPPPPDKTETHP